MIETELKPALFLDRDGVINVDKGYVSRPEDFEFIPGAAACIARFNAMGWLVFVVTNQSGIARNFYTLDQMHALHAWMGGQLEAEGARLDAIYFCPYHEAGENPDFRRESEDRKPRPGMILRAFADFPVDRSRSFLIGDKMTDLLAADAAGIPGFLFDGSDLDRFALWALAGLGQRAIEAP